MGAEQLATREGFANVAVRRCLVPWRREMRAVVGQHRVGPIGNSVDQAAQKVGGDAPGGALVQLGKGEFRCPVNGDKHVELALLSPHLGDVDVKVADRVGLELLLRLRSLPISRMGPQGAGLFTR